MLHWFTCQSAGRYRVLLCSVRAKSVTDHDGTPVGCLDHGSRPPTVRRFPRKSERPVARQTRYVRPEIASQSRMLVPLRRVLNRHGSVDPRVRRQPTIAGVRLSPRIEPLRPDVGPDIDADVRRDIPGVRRAQHAHRPPLEAVERPTQG